MRCPPGFVVRWLPVVLLCLCLPACTSLLQSRTERTLALARAHGLQSIVLHKGGFSLLALFKKTTSPTPLLVIYVEGDGVAWLDRSRLSPDPTPRDPLVLRLMVQDPNPAVGYLGRPCQYAEEGVHACPDRYWSSHRYAPEVVAAMGAAIDQMKEHLQSAEIGLVGYSGGGTVAALLAAERRDVRWLITIAANLDVAAWTRHHQVSPMPHSANPVDVADRLGPIPQWHFVGAEDERVPEVVLQSYLSHLPSPNAATLQRVSRMDHECCWEKAWPALLAQVPFRRE
ncbi:MAG: alpha/beta hydrolase [Magnetococcales bacterium]|nr:alpha/beta hydrolase [Magnetococcales bacterium]